MAAQKHGGLRVLLVERQRMCREVMARELARRGLEIVGMVETPKDALRLMEAVEPRVIVLSLRDAGEGDIQAAGSLLVGFPAAKVIAIGKNDDRLAARATAAGVHAFAGRDISIDELLALMGAVVDGRRLVWVKPGPAGSGPRRAPGAPGQYLTPREREILRLLASAASNAAIAERLGLRESTVRNHVHSILTKLQVRSRLEAVATIDRAGRLAARSPSHARSHSQR